MLEQAGLELVQTRFSSTPVESEPAVKLGRPRKTVETAPEVELVQVDTSK